jgi:hypothetical protein
MKLSVMMITYNHERFIAQALESVLTQQVNFEYEIVVGEDCSMDRTREILMDFHRQHPDRIVPLLRQRNLGAMGNFAETLAACRGEYVAFLEADDYWTCADKLQKQTDFLNAHPDFAICCARAQLQSEMAARQDVGVFPSHAAGAHTIEDLLAGNFIVTCTSVFRREKIGRLPGWLLEMSMGDWPLHVLVARSGKIWLMNEVMATYRIHPGGIWTSLSEHKRLSAMIRMMTELDRQLGFRYTKIIQKTIGGFYSGMTRISRDEGKRAATGKYLAYCLWNGGWAQRGSRRLLASCAAYALMGSWYKVFFKTKREAQG